MESDPALNYECSEGLDMMKLYTSVFSVRRENFLLSFIRSSESNLSTCILGTLHLSYEENGEVKPLKFIKLEKCSKLKSAFLILLILLRFPDESGHSLCLIIDNRRHEIEFFDSNGAKGYWWKTVDNYLGIYSSDNFPSYTYVSTLSFCPIGPQYVSQDEYCNLWNLLYIYLRLKYPVINRKLIIKYLLDNNNKGIAMSFLCYLDAYATKNKMYQAIAVIESTIENMETDLDLERFRLMESYRLKADYESIIKLRYPYN